MWRASREEFIPVLANDVEIRQVLFSTNAIESLHARYRRAVTVRGHFPTEQAALKCLYLVTRGLDPKGTGQARWTMRWKPALNAFTVPSPTACRPWRPSEINARTTVHRADPKLRALQSPMRARAVQNVQAAVV